jgi:biopolymer transport protein ExbB
MKIMNKKFFSFFSVFLVFCIFLTSYSFAAEQQTLGKIDYIYLLKTSFVMMALLGQSVVTLAFILERYFYFKIIKFNSKKRMKEIKENIVNKNFDALLASCEKKKNPLNNVIKAIVENRDKDKSDLEEIYEITRSNEKDKMEKFMVILGTSTAIAPLLGLLGTVTGIMTAFSNLAASGTGGPAVIASGVSEALVTTAFGLLIGIPVLFFFNIFNSKIKFILSELDSNQKLLFLMLEKK